MTIDECLSIHGNDFTALMVCEHCGHRQKLTTSYYKALTSLVTEIEALIAESHGVAGLHLNGDVATWDELEPGGRFERLTSLADARAAIAAAKGETR